MNLQYNPIEQIYSNKSPIGKQLTSSYWGMEGWALFFAQPNENTLLNAGILSLAFRVPFFCKY